MGVLFCTILVFWQFFYDFITVFIALDILWVLFSPMGTLTIFREAVKCIKNPFSGESRGGCLYNRAQKPLFEHINRYFPGSVQHTVGQNGQKLDITTNF